MSASSLNPGRITNVAGSVLLAVAWGLFAYSQLLNYERSGELPWLLLAIAYALTALLFLIRQAPKSVSSLPVDWIVAIAGTVAPFLFRPPEGGMPVVAAAVIGVGVVLLVLGLLSLNRSIGIVAARRTIRTGGMYRIVRHPIYASELLILAGYGIANDSVPNLVVLSAAAFFLALRIRSEETHLAEDPVYRDYTARVRWRVLPFVY